MANLEPRRNGAAGRTRSKLDRARAACGERGWADAHTLLKSADKARPLGADDLERLATAAYLSGHDEDYLDALNRAHKAHVDADRPLRAVRCAFWIGIRLAFRGEMGPATGWFGRAQRLMEQADKGCAEQGYVLLPAVEGMLGAGKYADAHDMAVRAGGIGQAHGDEDLVACALHLRGRALIRQERVAEGLALLDEAMVAVTAGDMSPIMKGLIYCAVIDACQQVHALDRAGQWTAALDAWCNEQPQMTAFTGECLAHRAQVLRFGGAWGEAIEEARRACIAGPRGPDGKPPPVALYEEGEALRLRGEFKEAEAAYQRAGQYGLDPQPGLALLRLAQGRGEAAATAISRVLDATEGAVKRVRLLPAHVEIMLAAGDLNAAREACGELGRIAGALGVDALTAMAAHAQGAVALAAGEARTATGALGRALAAWQKLDAPYGIARTRELMGLACRALGDEDGAAQEFAAASALFARLGAAPDLDRMGGHASNGGDLPGGLTAREVEVLRAVATGQSNKAVAAGFGLSVRTVERHLENVFRKLDISSRAAATAYAYRHKLV